MAAVATQAPGAASTRQQPGDWLGGWLLRSKLGRPEQYPGWERAVRLHLKQARVTGPGCGGTKGQESKEELQIFSSAMDDAWSLYGEELLSAMDLSCFHTVCDLGGNSDAFAKKYISLYPNATVTIFDLPEVVEKAKHLVSSEEQRITFQGGGGVLIVDTVLNEDKTGPLEAHIYSIVMLIYGEGKERTPSEHKALLGAAGFKEMQTAPEYAEAHYMEKGQDGP
ncbi:hypothetical protein JD844_032252 [Phrynosoma platyrhinos]|uniref:Acetylserotonin O-methyltransferase n=1 Tax=Phrynosoma platyrhinos TaxID=52577 RepID=A0ABQ7T4J9_PHRPL|nr:hypothetical protein JD844_032252 [Phrynosoma platyrhinos]